MNETTNNRKSGIRIDETSLEIIKRLSGERQPLAQIAEELHISEGTVRNRINKLEQAGVLCRRGLVDVDALPGHMALLVGVKLTNTNFVAKARELESMRGVVSVMVVTGSFDIFLLVMLDENFGLLEFFNAELAAHADGIQSTETFVVYKGFNFNLPYML
ncbi:Lrp/AsnC family transcriptional regulator [Fretibacterium sp. OH1220_COT-178]|uniref:Lrp/AsnC family transcriptional regulator n=1 Tax=Fretibacterium sp. OH1220_COT-178 TaxID=2491047 RepID=UPI0018F4CD79|nr:Lrp/AsnC family transcriptional regulator [Fretibacterium sp. OH1220_COT-178]